MPAERSTPRRYRGKSVEERVDERRSRLLEAGLDSFGSAGFAASSIEGICSSARVSTRHFYELFETKEALLLAVDAAIVEEAAALIRGLLADGPTDFPSRCRIGLRAYADVLFGDPRKGRVHFFEVLGVSGDAEAHRRVTGAQLMAIFLEEGDRLMEAGEIPGRDLGLTSVALLGATRYAMTEWALSPEGHSLDEVIDELTRLFVAGLFTDD